MTTYNKFKDTTIYGRFINDSSGSFIADASFNGNVNLVKSLNINGNIYLGVDSKIYSNGTEIFSFNNIRIGGNAGLTNQNINCISIGGNSGVTNQGNTYTYNTVTSVETQVGNSIAIGVNAGETNQKPNSIAIGKNCGKTEQGYASYAIGRDCGVTNQGDNCVAHGTLCGKLNQGLGSYCLGQACGEENIGIGSIALGYMCGRYDMKNFAISLGFKAGYRNQHEKTICINADDSGQLNTDCSMALFINPIRNNPISTSNIVAYNPSSKEVFYTNNVVSVDVSNNYLKIFDASNTYVKLTNGNITGNFSATSLNVSGKITSPYAHFTIRPTDVDYTISISENYSGYYVQISIESNYGIVQLFSAATFGQFGNPNARIQIQSITNKGLTIVSPNSAFYSNGNVGAPAITLQYLETVSLVADGYNWSITSTSLPPLTTKGLDSTSSIYTTNVYSRCSVINSNFTGTFTNPGGAYLVYASVLNFPKAFYYSYDTATQTFTNLDQQPMFHIFNGHSINNLTLTFQTLIPNSGFLPENGAFGLYGRNSNGLFDNVTSYVVLPYQSVTITPTGRYWLLLSVTN